MINQVQGNIFDTDKQVIVNAVNCVGVMGAGIALEYRLRYPEMFEKYQVHCQKKLLDIGKLWIYKPLHGAWVLNFPTKKHWKYPSKEEYLRKGLEKFCDIYKAKGIKSIAFPMLGADRGGLGQDKSLEIMASYLSELDLEVDIYHYDPEGKDALCEKVKAILLENSPCDYEHIVKFRFPEINKIKELLSNEPINQLSQLLKHKGVGQKSVEKLYLLASFENLAVAHQDELF